MGIKKPHHPSSAAAQGEKSLAVKINESQHRLQMLRRQSHVLMESTTSTISKPLVKKRRSLNTRLEESRKRLQNLVSNPPKLELPCSVPSLPPINNNDQKLNSNLART